MDSESEDSSQAYNYHELMGSVGNLRDDDQSNYNTNRKKTKGSFITPMNGGKSDVNWWNEYPTDDVATNFRSNTPYTKTRTTTTTTATKPSRPQRVPTTNRQVEEDEEEIPLVNLDAPSPIIWTVGVIIIMVLIMIAELYQFGLSQIKNIFSNDNPLGGPGDDILLLLGAKFGPMIVDGDWWRLFSAIFLQNGIIMCIISIVILIYERKIERDTGFYRMMLTFMVCGVYGYILSCIFIPRAISAGTTGSIIGLLGVMICDLIASWKIDKHPILNLITIIVFIVVLIVFGLFPFVDNFSHIGGLIMGVLTGLMLTPNLNFGKNAAVIHGIISLIAFPVMSTLFMICLVIVFRSNNTDLSWCKGCDKINCVNFKPGWCNTEQN